ncbi:hypothetical protein [Polaromonas sp. UC242_47]|uniref:hypothetical protein n=1 Tax=Polaromonas sp. UC242_47 TaxID=3374626 RepID=UPI0037961930
MTSTARHIDQSARMVWLSLRRAARPMTVNELVMHWKPVFDAVQMEDCLNRLTATGHASACAFPPARRVAGDRGQPIAAGLWRRQQPRMVPHRGYRMSTANLINTCGVCGAEESLDGLLLRMIDDDQVRHLIAAVVTDSLPLGGMVVRDPRLHKPPKQKLRIGVVGRLLAELAPTYSATASSVLAAPGWSTATAGRPHFRPSLTPMTRAR